MLGRRSLLMCKLIGEENLRVTYNGHIWASIPMNMKVMVKLSLYQAVEARRVVRPRGSHIF
jgi:hypothetical protein